MAPSQGNSPFNAEGRPIGYAKRDRTISINRIPLNWEARWYKVVLGDVAIGEVLAQRGANNPQGFITANIPAVRPAALALPKEDELWLLAVATIELAHWHVHAERL